MYEYMVRPAPKKGQKGKGMSSAEDRFAHALSLALNEAATDGWEYLRAETLPAESRQGLTGRSTTYQNMLVFRRPLAPEAETLEPSEAQAAPLAAPEPAQVHTQDHTHDHAPEPEEQPEAPDTPPEEGGEDPRA